MTDGHHCIIGSVLERQRGSFKYKGCFANWSEVSGYRNNGVVLIC